MDTITDFITIKKKLSAYSSDKGYLKNVSDELHYEVLKAWENWTGPSKEFYRQLGFSRFQMASLIGKAKRMQREGCFGDGDFKEIKTEESNVLPFKSPSSGPAGIEVIWKDGSVIRFYQVDMLLEFLKKAA